MCVSFEQQKQDRLGTVTLRKSDASFLSSFLSFPHIMVGDCFLHRLSSSIGFCLRIRELVRVVEPEKKSVSAMQLLGAGAPLGP